MDTNCNLLSKLSHQLLKEFQVPTPSQEQVETAQSFILKVICDDKLAFDGRLTPRESVCLYWAACGKSSEETASILCISRGTVDTHRKRIIKKLKCRNMANAIYKGMKYAHLCSEASSDNSQDKKYLNLRTIFL